MGQTTRDENLAAEIDRVAKIMLGDSNDPTSYNYKRKLNRPSINWVRIALWCVLTIGGIVALGAGLSLLSVDKWIARCACFAIFAIMVAMNLKRILICLVRIYQRYAPDSIRNKCRFEPSCSEYMILSLDKFGALKGLKKGIGRLTRCNVNGGGFDYP